MEWLIYVCNAAICFASSIKRVIEQNSGSEQACDERDGWCVLGTTDKLRDIISALIKKVIRVQKPGKENIHYQECALTHFMAAMSSL